MTESGGLLRRIAGALVYIAYVVVFVVAVDYVFFWRPWVASLRGLRRTELPSIEQVDETTMRRLGALLADRTSSFPRYSPSKPRGVLRLCALGDSFTYGDETADGHDYPELLERLFVERGATNVEVVNFGNPWYGFHQAYFLWEGVGRRYECDVVLLGPECFEPYRDTTFNHTGMKHPYYLHARFVVDGDGVRPVEVIGADPDERFAAYTRFFSPLRYLRYDRNPPPALRAMMLQGRTVDNPFYYDDRSRAEEAHETYRGLLAQLVADGRPAVLLHSQQAIVRVALDVDSPLLQALHTPRVHRYPLVAPGGHYSAFGNRLVAEQFFNVLLEGEAMAQTLGFDRPTAPAPVDRGRTMRGVPISSYERVEVTLGGAEAGFLAAASPDPGSRGGAPTDLHESPAVSLLALVAAGATFVDAPILVVSGPIDHGQELTFRAAGGHEGVESVLGRVELLDDRGSVGLVEVAGLQFRDELRLRLASDDGTRSSSAERGLGVIALAGRPVFTVVPIEEGFLRLDPVDGPLRSLRVGAGDYADPSALGEGGEVGLRFSGDAGERNVTIARWRRGGPPPPFAPPKVRPLLRIVGARAELVESAR